jgi:hypothetical protein
MITPSYSLTATERVLPKLALDFTTAILDPRVTFTRSGNTATVINSSGVITAINANLPRFDYNPTTLVCNGLLIEESRSNLLLNSLINGTNLSTQLVTTAAVANTLSFYGTGQIVLTGTSSATVVGTGAYPTRTTLTFTPTAGVLTLTVTGTVQYAQLEAGAFATSFIPTAASTVTRSADIATMTSTNFSSWYNATEGTFVATTNKTTTAVTANYLLANDGTNTNRMQLVWNSTTNSHSSEIIATTTQASLTTGAIAGGTNKASMAYKLNSIAASVNAATPLTDTSATIPTVNTLSIGSRTYLSNGFLNGWFTKLAYYPQRLTNAEVQAFSK